MAVSAHDVAAVLRQRLPGLPVKKLHKLLYYCQGHHMAATGQPLFEETISAWDMGPVVGQLWYRERNTVEIPDGRELDEAELNTIGYVLSRYGALTGLDLEHLTHHEDPYLLADRDRAPGTSVKIPREWIRDYFTNRADDQGDDEILDGDSVKAWLQDAARRKEGDVHEDATETILGRLLPDA